MDLLQSGHQVAMLTEKLHMLKCTLTELYTCEPINIHQQQAHCTATRTYQQSYHWECNQFLGGLLPLPLIPAINRRGINPLWIWQTQRQTLTPLQNKNKTCWHADNTYIVNIQTPRNTDRKIVSKCMFNVHMWQHTSINMDQSAVCSVQTINVD